MSVVLTIIRVRHHIKDGLYTSKVSLAAQGVFTSKDRDPLRLVPAYYRPIVKGYLQSRMPQDETRGRELCREYKLDYDGIRARWHIDMMERRR